MKYSDLQVWQKAIGLVVEVSTNAFLNHLSIADGSLMELETHLQISLRLGYLVEAL